jgi:ABC-type branched-subunit amino acid transport system permease subunit
MLGTNINETTIFIAVIVAIFGGVAGAFFVKSRSGAKTKATT